MKKFTESMSNIKKVETNTLKYFELFPLLDGLEGERPGIRKRVWDWLKGEPDEFQDIIHRPINNRILNINLFYFGVGGEYPLKYIKDYPGEIEHCINIHPENFIEGSKDCELRKDLNLIWYVYENDIDNVESFPIMPIY